MSSIAHAWSEELVRCIRFLHQKGLAPATSSNYSFRLSGESHLYISASGIDKGAFSETDLMLVDLEGKALETSRQPSAETLLHTLIYRMRPETGCVLHTHSIYNTVLSAVFEHAGVLRLAGFEMLKGLSGIHTHESAVDVPIFPNSQDMPALAADIEAYWRRHPDMRGFLLAGHGLYTWGSTIAETKRHVEVFEFLLECFYKIHTFKTSQNQFTNGDSTYS